MATPRSFPAAPAVKRVLAEEDGSIEVGLILDLGFRIYRETVVVLSGVVHVAPDLCESFATEWIKHAAPDLLSVHVETLTDDGQAIGQIRRIGFATDGTRMGFEDLCQTLVDQGIAEWTS